MMRGLDGLSLSSAGHWPTVSCIIVCLFGTIALYSITIKPSDESPDGKLSVIVDHLEHVQRRHAERQTKRQLEIDIFINERFPWLIQHRSLPNYFLHQDKQDDDDFIYSRGVLVFLHIPRTGGGAIQECLLHIGRNRSKVFSTAMTDSLRIAWDDESRLTWEYRNAFDGHVTFHAFGLCDHIKRPCSYATLMRHPLERAISSYFHCKESIGDSMCSVVNANDITLREWVIFQGSVFFRALLFRTSGCEKRLNVNITEYQLLTPAAHVPCWFKHKIWFDSLQLEEQNLLLEYVLVQLDKWFAVLGITEDIPSSTRMLERVYKLPFGKCPELQRSRQKDKKDEKFRQTIRTNSAHFSSLNPLSYEDYVELQYDYNVQKALDADYKLYEKIKHIVQLQKQIFSNKVKS